MSIKKHGYWFNWININIREVTTCLQKFFKPIILYMRYFLELCTSQDLTFLGSCEDSLFIVISIRYSCMKLFLSIYQTSYIFGNI